MLKARGPCRNRVLSNPEEAKQLAKPKYQDKIAASVYKGVLRYFTEDRDPPE